MAEEAKTKKQPAKAAPATHDKNNSPDIPDQGESVINAMADYFQAGCPVCNQIPLALCLFSRDGKIVVENPYCDMLLGYSRDELHNKPLASLMRESDVKDFKAFLTRNLQGTAGPYRIELIRKDGTMLWTIFNVTPFIDSNGDNPGFLASITDISDYKRVNEELSLFAGMLDSAKDSIFLREIDGTTIYANSAAYKERGYTKDELLKTGLFQIVAPEYHGTIRERIKTLITRGAITFEAAHLRKDGTSFPVEVHMSLVEHTGKKYMLSVVHDISQHKKIEEELMRALKMESVAVLAGGVASQFNTLLTHITGNLSVLMAETEPGTQRYRLLEETDRVADRARELVRHLMSFSVSTPPVKKITSVAGLVKDTADFVLSGSNTWCNFFIADDLYAVELDEAQFIQAISNVILNASQAMPKGGIINITAANVHLEENEVSNLGDGNYVRISVKDKGHGISPEHIQRIFDPYFTTRHGRLGLGLSIAYSVLRNHGGTITVESEHGKGSTFNIFLPASAVQDKTKVGESKRLSSGVKMLVVDDEAVIRSVGSRMLSRLGYDRVEFAEDGQEALSKYKSAVESGSPFDIVIVDLTLPGSMGGKEVVKSLLNMDANANIVISSGYFNDPIMTDFRRHGIKGVLSKPYKLEELELMLHESHREEVPH
jgi:two-component system, cell cycle sensor histidine kinase and response regulator CckA